MVRSIWKYPLNLVDQQLVEMPAGAVPRHVDVQHGQLCLWMEVDPNSDIREERLVRVVGTGHKFTPNATTTFVGSAQMAGGRLVWHVYVDGGVVWVAEPDTLPRAPEMKRLPNPDAGHGAGDGFGGSDF